jgi:hypothetical protein
MTNAMARGRQESEDGDDGDEVIESDKPPGPMSARLGRLNVER